MSASLGNVNSSLFPTAAIPKQGCSLIYSILCQESPTQKCRGLINRLYYLYFQSWNSARTIYPWSSPTISPTTPNTHSEFYSSSRPTLTRTADVADHSTLEVGSALLQLSSIQRPRSCLVHETCRITRGPWLVTSRLFISASPFPGRVPPDLHYICLCSSHLYLYLLSIYPGMSPIVPLYMSDAVFCLTN
ncbi:hypothetical protein BDY19DRAFT_566249 [Irpex rosettiformis]|uniref:Uncharacterized protein n=1 Tax=Irpex rosettiformis TaxID=378272 RepID=A0ACB8UCC9_9APHY|nr:hypothetical protein BDY19DRAFT_566249 [Irpex rosettiformis]